MKVSESVDYQRGESSSLSRNSLQEISGKGWYRHDRDTRFLILSDHMNGPSMTGQRTFK